MQQITTFDLNRKLPDFKNLRLLSPIAIFIIAVSLTTACSHVKPYYRSDDLKPTNISINQDEIRHRVLLIGDAGDPEINGGVLLLLQQWASLIPQRTTIIFLGDNIYPEGMPEKNDPNRAEAESRLMAQIGVIQQSSANAIFIPGNHDWAKGKPSGESAVKRQEKFINSILPGNDNMLPGDACPGPAKVDLDGLRIIALDTPWWFQDYSHLSKDHCYPDTKEAIVTKLKLLLQETPAGSKVIVVGHHPLISYGPRGGVFTWKDHLFPLTRLVNWLWIPLPGIGSLYPLSRSTFLKDKNDMGSPEYRNFKDHLLKAFHARKPLLYAAGHDHTLQVLDGGDAADYLLVSGAGSEDKIYDVRHGGETLFAHSHAGFMAVDFLWNSKVLLRVVEPGETETLLDHWLENDEPDFK